MARRIVVAMSGGVDSTISAALLRDRGWEVVGVFMQRGFEGDTDAAARNAAAWLGVEFHVLDVSTEFSRLIEEFCLEYRRGRTPNPCVRCNARFKFGRLAQFAREMGAEAVATGHYARVERRGERFCLRRGCDPNKDQSYALFGLSQQQLGFAQFPLGNQTKEATRALAKRLGFPGQDREESQEVCFVAGGDYRKLVAHQLGPSRTRGQIVDVNGNVLGEHKGVENFTIGQRRGLGIAVGEPRYVVRLDVDSQTVVVGAADDLACGELTAEDVNWVSVSAPDEPVRAAVQIRYKHKAAPATCYAVGERRVRVVFDSPVRAVTPGQAAVFYDEDRVVGGGWIK